jgi:hypothetical protein
MLPVGSRAAELSNPRKSQNTTVTSSPRPLPPWISTQCRRHCWISTWLLQYQPSATESAAQVWSQTTKFV